MTITISGQGTLVYDDLKNLDYRAGAEVMFRHCIGWGFGEVKLGVGSAASAKVKAGVEFPLYDSRHCNRYSQNGTRLGLSLYGEGKGAYHFTKNKAEEGSPLNGAQKTMWDAGGGAEFIIHSSGIFEGAIGVKGGYRRNSYQNDNAGWTGTWTDNALSAQLNPAGKGYITPTAEILFHLGHGVSIGASADFFEAKAGINYTF